MSSWHAYGKVYNIGHAAIDGLLTHPVVVEEKVDGSQFSFGLFPDEDGSLKLKVRSRGAVMQADAPEKMFAKGVEAIDAILHRLTPGWTYRGEYLAKPKHNALAYERVPQGHTIIFDINTDEESYLNPVERLQEAHRIGLECVPVLTQGIIQDVGEFHRLLDTTSVLGGQKIEGVVVKPVGYNLFGRDGKCLMGKFVSEAFKEVHAKAWKNANPGGKDILAILGDRYHVEARWQKAVQHLAEAGKLEHDVTDIGALMKSIPEDVLAECGDEIKEMLFAWAWPHIRRMVVRGVPQWYKDQLLVSAFESKEE